MKPFFPMYEGYDPQLEIYRPFKPVRVRDLMIREPGSDPPEYVNVIYTLEHGFEWSADSLINKYLYQEYHNMYSVYPVASEMQDELIAYINLVNSYWNDFYATTQYEYNPISNYDMTEQEKNCGRRDVVRQNHSSVSDKSENKESAFGYNSTNPTATAKSESSGTQSNVGGGGENEKHGECRILTRSGNVGVTTSQQMIQSQRDILVNVVGEYVKSFSQFFMVI